MRKQSRARRLLRGARNVPCLCCHIISQPLQCLLFQLLNSLQSAALWVELELCTVHSIIYSHVAALPSKITQLHGGTNAWTHGQTNFRTNRTDNTTYWCALAHKNIPYGQSSAKLPITWSLGYKVTWSLGYKVTWSLSHLVTWSLSHSVTR